MLINCSRCEGDLEASSMSSPAFSRSDSDDRCGNALNCAMLAYDGTAASFVAAAGADFPCPADVSCVADGIGAEEACCEAAVDSGADSPPPHPVRSRLKSSIHRARKKWRVVYETCTTRRFGRMSRCIAKHPMMREQRGGAARNDDVASHPDSRRTSGCRHVHRMALDALASVGLQVFIERAEAGARSIKGPRY